MPEAAAPLATAASPEPPSAGTGTDEAPWPDPVSAPVAAEPPAPAPEAALPDSSDASPSPAEPLAVAPALETSLPVDPPAADAALAAAPQDAPGDVPAATEAAPAPSPEAAADEPRSPLLDVPEPPADYEVPEADPGYRPVAGMMMVEEMLGRATSREKIAEALLWFAEGRFTNAVLFTVSEDRFQAWQGMGPAADQGLLKDLTVPRDQASVLRRALEGTQAVVTAPPGESLDRRLALYLGHTPSSQLAAVRIEGKGRVVSVFFGTRGAFPMREQIGDELDRVGHGASRAYERLLASRKLLD